MKNFRFDEVQGHINNAVNVAIARIEEREAELFLSELASSGNGGASPFQKMILPEAKLYSSFERSLSASLGKAFDYIGAAIAKAAYGNGEHDYVLDGEVSAEALSTIEEIVNKYKQRIGVMPSTTRELEEVFSVVDEGHPTLARKIKSDVFFIDHEGYENYLEIKTPQPNYDQCSAMKVRILTVHAMRRHQDKVRALVVFPHSPNGLFGDYAWPPLQYFFDPSHDWHARGLSLMGPGLWNFIGNSGSTFQCMMDCFYEVSVLRKQDLLELLKLDAPGGPISRREGEQQSAP
ncbi:TdeIII family type II restriction endonuclease [Primorskyibacter aestuariivivens]|uniref:TdeIII family type II restriction endonuclease n=1 Tax=Primorskyibacter aestuariivivens TaxID=1888912 RepID=UPI0023011192|nr:TdeIII family type II restriction endonuclease [Primorskyibacter aestuariivivens]MDA7430188.1 TdeIII family type II restriction endonuclease [Primorskyibacter aestuariivivens]